MGKSTISMAIFNSFLYVYQAGYPTSITIRIYPGVNHRRLRLEIHVPYADFSGVKHLG